MSHCLSQFASNWN